MFQTKNMNKSVAWDALMELDILNVMQTQIMNLYKSLQKMNKEREVLEKRELTEWQLCEWIWLSASVVQSKCMLLESILQMPDLCRMPDMILNGPMHLRGEISDNILIFIENLILFGEYSDIVAILDLGLFDLVVRQLTENLFVRRHRQYSTDHCMNEMFQAIERIQSDEGDTKECWMLRQRVYDKIAESGAEDIVEARTFSNKFYGFNDFMINSKKKC